MFDTVPAELTRALRGLPAGMKAPDVRHLAAGGLVTAHYLRNAGPLQRCGMLPDGDLEREDAARLVQIGDLLFTLRDEPGFGALCRRLREAPLRAALFELTAALMFKRAGFQVHAGPEVPLSRYDCALQVVHGPTSVNVATTILGGKYRRDATVAALRRKRLRLPDDRPGVLLCQHPASWRKDAWDLDFELSAIARTILRQARRINYLLFSEERFTPVEGGGIISSVGMAVRNPGARLSCPPLDAAMMDHAPASPESEAMLAVPRRIDEGAFGAGDFDQWVNWAAEN